MRSACACHGHAVPVTPRTAAVLDCRNPIEAFALYMAGRQWVCKTHWASVRPPCRPACPAHTRRPCWSLAASLPASSGSSHVFHTLLAIGQPPLCRKPGHDTGGGAGPGRASGTDHLPVVRGCCPHCHRDPRDCGSRLTGVLDGPCLVAGMAALAQL